LITPNSDRGEGFIKVDAQRGLVWGYNPAHRIYQGWGKSAGFSGYFVIQFETGIGTFGVYKGAQMVGFARVITDTATFAYLADVFIDEAYRGQGLSKWLMEVILSHPDLQGLRRFLLATRDAHGLYRQFDFKELPNPEYMLAIAKPDIYKMG